jgi:hypothetical protein
LGLIELVGKKITAKDSGRLKKDGRVNNQKYLKLKPALNFLVRHTFWPS